ncbi:hypothetical protein GGH15_001766 [Coemansia sp. RSA 562]|nr:hypothetical protein GGH15_001766 [Coemansia sp. RSA 562]
MTGPVLRKRPIKQAEPTGTLKRKADQANLVATPIRKTGKTSKTSKESGKENKVCHSEDISPMKTQKLEANTTQKATVKPFVTPRTSRSSKPGAVCSYGKSEKGQNEDEVQYAWNLVNNYTHRDIDELLDFAKPATAAGQEAAAQNVDFISDAMERILTKKRLPNGSGLDRRLLQKFANGIDEWMKVGSSLPSEKPLYGYFSNFALFVAQCLKSVAAGNNPHIAHLILPADRSDFKPDDSNDSRRIDVGLALRGIGASVECVSLGSYADTLCVVEAKYSRNLDENALMQLFLYSANLYARQGNRRYLWGLTICADEVYACLMLNDGLFVSPAMRISELAGRKMLISWLVRWSMCPDDLLGYDPTMHRVTVHSDLDVAGSDNDDVDDIRYRIDCYDDESMETIKYVTKRTIMSADDILGRHTRCFVATRYSGSDAYSSATEVVIKDAWPPTNYPPLEDPRDEIKLLRKIHDTFKNDAPDHIYPELIVGGHVRLDQEAVSAIDTTDAIFKVAGVNRIDPPSDSDAESAWKYQPLRAHRRIVMSPVGHSIKTVQNEAELIIVLVEAMQCYSSVLDGCGVLHRDISTNNILVVRDGKDTIPRGLLIDFDFAVKVDTHERSARPERSGTLPYMSIANILNLDTPRTALDDWESLLYVVCWLATVGITSSHRVSDAELEKKPIKNWRIGSPEEIADVKRAYLDDDDDSDKPTDGSIDPLVKRGAHIEAIITDLKKVLDKFKLEALAAL